MGYITKPISLTVTVIASKSIADMFRDFWGTYGQFIGIFACAFKGAFAKVPFDRRNMNLQNRLDGKFVLESVDAEESCGLYGYINTANFFCR